MAMYQVCYCESFNDYALGNDESPLRKKFDSIVEDLKENRRTSLGDVKVIKGDGNVKYFRAKLSDSDRLLFSSIKYNDEDGFVLLEVILNHDYNKSKFLKNKEKIKFIKIFYNKDGKTIHDDVEITDASKIHWFGKFVTFSARQEDIVENTGGKYKLPLVVIGHAGSGKTSVALEKLRKIEDELEEGKILYITHSENLIKQSKELYEYEYWDSAANELRIGLPEQIDFLSIHGFLEKITRHVEEKKAIDRNVFFSWFEGICNQAKFNEFKKDVDKVFEEFTAVIAGGGLASEGGKQQYMKLGKRQSIFSEDKRGSIYDLFEEYKKFVKGNSEYYDSSLVASDYLENEQSIKVRGVYDVVVIDEVQDLTRSMLALILKSLKDNFLLCGDVNQVIHPSFFSASKLKDFLCKDIVNKGTKLKICSLEKNYRNSQQVIDLANRILHLKNYCFASEDTLTEEEKMYFFMRSEIQNAGYVGLIAEVEEISKIVSESTGYAILVLDNAYKEEAKNSFETPLIFNIQEAKGLEFKNVILCKWDEAYNKVWNIVCPNKAKTKSVIDEIRRSYEKGNINTSRPKDKTDKSFEEYKFYVNALYVGVTRAIDNVYIVGDKKQLNLLKVVVPGEEINIVDTASIEKKESNPEEWRDMALDLINKGNLEQAKGIAKKLLNKKEYVQEIIAALKAQKWNKEAEEIQSALTKAGKKDKRKRVVKPSLDLKTSKKNPNLQSSQKGIMNDTNPETPTEGTANQKDNQNMDLRQNEGLVEIICNDEIKEFEKTDISLYNKQDIMNLAFEKSSLHIANHLIKEFTPKIDKKSAKIVELFKQAVQGGHKDIVELLLDCGAIPENISREDALYVAAGEGHKDVVELFLNRGANIDDGDNAFTPLYAAALKDHTDVVDFLLDRKANVNASKRDDYTLLHLALYKGHENVAKVLLSKGADVNAKTKRGTTPLHMAVFKGYDDIAKTLLNKGADVNARSNNNTTPLYMAAQGGHKDIAKYLVSRGANVDDKDEKDLTLLHLAAQKGHKDVAQIILDCKADVNAKTKDNFTPLYIAVKERHKDIIDLLLNHKADVNVKDKEGRILLHMAVQNDLKNAVESLLIRGVDVDTKSEDGVTPLHMAAQAGHQDICVILLNHGADINVQDEKGCIPLHAAVQNGHKDVVDLLVGHGADVNVTDKDGFTSLHMAADKGCVGVAEILLAKGADVNAKNNKGITPLYLAAQNGNKINFEVLLSYGADINVQHEDGSTPLSVAAKSGHKDIVEILLDKKADVNTNTAECTPLQMAVQEGHDKIVDLFLDGGANLKNEDGYTLMLMAAFCGHKNVIDLLLRYGANINAKDKEGRTLLHIAVQNDRMDVVHLLLPRGANINAKDDEGYTSLNIAVQTGDKEKTRDLLAEGANVNVKTKQGVSPLHIAAFKGYKDIVKMILSNGAEVNAKTKQGSTALCMAAQEGHKEIVQILLSKNADANIRSKQGNTPLYLAAFEGHKDVARLLVSKGGANANAWYRKDLSLLHAAAHDGHKNMVKILIQVGADVNGTNHSGDTPLFMAAQRGHKDVVEILLDRGADINCKATGYTPLCIAAYYGHIGVVEVLLDRGGNENSIGLTSLYWAAQRNHNDLVDFLLNRGFDINAKDKEGDSILHVAAHEGQKDTVEFLIDKGADVNGKNESGYTPLCMAAQSGHKDLIEFLLDRGCDFDTKSSAAFGAIFWAAEGNHKGVVDLLMDRGVDINATDEEGTTLLHMAALGGRKHVAEVFLTKGANVSIKDEHGSSPLHTAAEEGYKDVAKVFLDHKADVNARDAQGCTALFLAVENNHKDVVELLLHCYADINAADNDGITPLRVALELGHSEIVRILLANPNINVTCATDKYTKKQEDRIMFQQKVNQDSTLYDKVLDVMRERNEEKKEKLLEEVTAFLKTKTASGFKPSVKYSPLANNSNTTLEITFSAGNQKLLSVLLCHHLYSEVSKQLKDEKKKENDSNEI